MRCSERNELRFRSLCTNLSSSVIFVRTLEAPKAGSKRTNIIIRGSLQLSLFDLRDASFLGSCLGNRAPLCYIPSQDSGSSATLTLKAGLRGSFWRDPAVLSGIALLYFTLVIEPRRAMETSLEARLEQLSVNDENLPPTDFKKHQSIKVDFDNSWSKPS
jgi:hypothetical protein